MIIRLVLLSIVIISCVFALEYLTGIENSKYTKHMGDKYVLNGDTLIIIDFSKINETYLLSNGQKIDKSLVK